MLWKVHGKLKWSTLIEPSIKLARDGFPLPVPVHGAMLRSEKKIRNDPGLRYVPRSRYSFRSYSLALFGTVLIFIFIYLS